MKTTLFPISISIAFLLSATGMAAPPFTGTLYMNPDVITPADPTCFSSVSPAGQGMRTMFDRRANGGSGGWVDLNAYLFNASYSDGRTIEIQVNPEFTQTEAASQAGFYAPVIGRLPACLREDVQTVWLHKGDMPFGGGNNNLLIHTDYAANHYIGSGYLEEAFLHEACHTSLDADHAAAAGWLAAASADGEAISDYARDYPATEDVAESFLPWFALRHKADRLTQNQIDSITNTIPNRLAYFDAQGFDLFPAVGSAPFAVTAFSFDKPTGNWTIRWNSRPGTNYVIRTSGNLETWQLRMSGVASQGTVTEVSGTESLPGDKRFFRVEEETPSAN